MEADSKDGYIHIAEAVKKYNKTRQTFYNYMHKGIIESKKVHNKVYLKISDIEGLQSNYLDENSSGYTYDTESDTYIFGPAEEIDSTLPDIEEKLKEIEEELQSKLSMLRDQTIFQRTTFEESIKNEISSSTTLLQNRLDSLSSSFFSFQSSAWIRQKKSFFYISYLLFIVVNTILLKTLYSL